MLVRFFYLLFALLILSPTANAQAIGGVIQVLEVSPSTGIDPASIPSSVDRNANATLQKQLTDGHKVKRMAILGFQAKPGEQIAVNNNVEMVDGLPKGSSGTVTADKADDGVTFSFDIMLPEGNGAQRHLQKTVVIPQGKVGVVSEKLDDDRIATLFITVGTTPQKATN